MNHAIFEIVEILFSRNNEVQLKGRALGIIKDGDDLYLSSDKNSKVKVKGIIFWNDAIDQIESPHACTLILATPWLNLKENKYLFDGGESI